MLNLVFSNCYLQRLNVVDLPPFYFDGFFSLQRRSTFFAVRKGVNLDLIWNLYPV